MSCDKALDVFYEELSSRVLVGEEHDFQMGHSMPSLWPQELKKKALPG